MATPKSKKAPIKIDTPQKHADIVIEKDEEIQLTEKQRLFCKEYIFDFNASRAARDSGYSEDTCASIGCENLTKPNIKAYIKELQSNMEETSGISRLRVLREHEKLAFTSIAHLHETWITRKEFEKLTDDQKACIAEIQTQTRTVMDYSADPYGTPATVEFIKVKLYDKQKALDSISKMLGFDSAVKIDHTSKGEKITAPPPINVYSSAPPLASSEDVIDEKDKV